MASEPTRRSPGLGLDFVDKNVDDHPDFASIYTDRPSHLKRNLTERNRLQTLQRRLTMNSDIQAGPFQPTTLVERINLWLINEGGRQVFFGVWIFLHLLVAAFGFVHFYFKDDLVNARRLFGNSYIVARTSALLLHIDAIFILLPVCRNLISLLRRTPLNNIIPFEKNITFHKATGWSIVTWSLVHIIAHLVNFGRLALSTPTAKSPQERFFLFLTVNFATGPGATGWIMTVTLGIMAYFSLERKRRERFEVFWYTHHLFLVFFITWQLHGMFCMIKPDRPPYCSSGSVGVFWKYWMLGGVIWAYERILREIRSRHVTYISKAIQHPSNVLELQIKKEKTAIRAGQYVYLSCPEVSYFQWHPFTLTSAPEEDYLSVHIRIVGDFTRALAQSVGCDFGQEGVRSSQVVAPPGDNNLRLNPVLPRIMLDGPFGSASEDFMNYETVLLVGAGIGVTPFASVLKSIWYRMNGFNYSKRTRLSKVYFVWVIRDYDQAEWFHSLLHAIEEQDAKRRIDISIYLTGKVGLDDINNIMVHDVGAEKDTITSLNAPTHFGRPNWDKVFGNIVAGHSNTDVGVFFCGPRPLSKELHSMCNKYSDPRFQGTRFFYKKENF